MNDCGRIQKEFSGYLDGAIPRVRDAGHRSASEEVRDLLDRI